MEVRAQACALFIVLVTLAPAAHAAGPAPERPRALPNSSSADDGEVAVPYAVRPIVLDGRLTEESWRSARPLGPLTQREPREGTEPSERTDVYLTFDRNHLYVGVICHDSAAGAVVATQMGRDAELSVDDTIEIVLDTFFDHRNGYYFQTNPLGARVDGLISANGEPNKEWDGIWHARAVRTGEGWSAEMAIPFKTLNFSLAQTSWGFNIQRTIKRKQETIRWRAARQNLRLAQVSEAGVITGLADLRQGRGLDLRPYGAFGLITDRPRVPRGGDLQAGLDVVKNVTPSLTATLTVNTDFAETEVDARQVNLTRFSLFFPEKRTFFLQNAGIFQTVGQGQRGDQVRATDIVPFFTRRIGLRPDGQPLPVQAGAKLAGRAGAWSLGLLDVRTRESDGFQPRNYFAARASRNLGRQSLVGVLVTHGSPSGDARPLVGADGRYSRSDLFGSRNLVVEGAAFKVLEGGQAAGAGETWAATFRADYPNDPLGINISFKQIGEGFNPGLGFVPRRGIRKGNYNIDYFQRPRKWGIRHQHWELMTETIHGPDWRLLNWRIFTAPLNLRTESGEHIEWNYIPEYEFLDRPFEIRPGIVVPAGGYAMHRYRAELNTATKRRVVYDISVRYGDFYGGRRIETTTSVRWKPSRHLALQLSLSRNDVDLPQEQFDTSIWQTRVDVGFSPNVTLNSFFQYDTVSRVAGLNSRFRWILEPGNDLFFVVNVGLQNEDDGWVRAYERVTSKVQYTWRF